MFIGNKKERVKRLITNKTKPLKQTVGSRKSFAVCSPKYNNSKRENTLPQKRVRRTYKLNYIVTSLLKIINHPNAICSEQLEKIKTYFTLDFLS